MSFTILKKNPSQGEITSSLTGSTGDGSGLHFNGSGYVSAGDTTVIDGATKLSVEVIAATTAADDGEMIAKAYAATALRFFVNSSGQVVFRVNNGSGNGTATSSGTVIDGNPTHIVGVWDGSTVKIYINGNEDGSAALSGGAVPNVTDQLALGAQQSSGGGTANKFTGTLYRARLFNYAVDAKSLFENGASVDFADQYGSQTKLIDSDFNGSFDGWNTSNDWATQTNNSNAMQLVADAANQICRTSTQLTKGKRYRVTYTASGVTGSPGFSTAAATHVVAGVISAGTANSFEFTFPTSATSQYFYIKSNASGDAVTLDDISVVQIGALVDYDLAFANENQSRMVQDRAGVADATIGVTGGVTQVQPVVQGNLTSLAVTTSQQAAGVPADGDIEASGTIKSQTLKATKVDSTDQLYLERTNSSTGKFYLGAAANSFFIVDDAQSQTRIKIDNTGGVQIGGDGTARELRWGNTYANNGPTIIGHDVNGTFQFYPAGNGSGEAMKLSSDKLATFYGGINLGDTTLSNYKEGTFTPTLSKDNFSTTISSPDVATGRYVRVGKMCYIIVYWYKTACPTTTGGSAYKIGGLPFSFVQDSPYQFLNAGYVIFNGNSFNTSPYRWQVNDASAVTFYGTQAATNWTSGALEFSACGVLEIA